MGNRFSIDEMRAHLNTSVFYLGNRFDIEKQNSIQHSRATEKLLHEGAHEEAYMEAIKTIYRRRKSKLCLVIQSSCRAIQTRLPEMARMSIPPPTLAGDVSNVINCADRVDVEHLGKVVDQLRLLYKGTDVVKIYGESHSDALHSLIVETITYEEVMRELTRIAESRSIPCDDFRALRRSKGEALDVVTRQPLDQEDSDEGRFEPYRYSKSVSQYESQQEGRVIRAPGGVPIITTSP